MSESVHPLKSEFKYGTTTVQILQGDILRPGVPVDAVVSTDDNYLTMGSGVSRQLAKAAGGNYVRAAQRQCPVKAGTVVTTPPFLLPRRGLPVQVVLHGTVIDYDTNDYSLEELVHRTTANCLQTAEDLKLRSIVFPALATGAGGLSMSSCAHQMCSAIKVFLAQERLIKNIYIILWVPLLEDGTPDPDQAAKREPEYRPFLQEANMVLGTPYDPASQARQSHSFYGRLAELEQLKAIVSAQDGQSRTHAAILGGPAIGKGTLLNQLFSWAREPEGGLRPGQCVAWLEIGRVHIDTPSSFVYRKLLASLAEYEQDAGRIKDIRHTLTDPDLDCAGFLAFLDRHPDRYQEVVFLVDELPRLLDMDRPREGQQTPTPKKFWSDLETLQPRVRFVFTADYEDYQTLCRDRLMPLANAFHQNIQEVRLQCLSKPDSKTWIDTLFKDYLDQPNGAPSPVHAFFEREAGLHPYLTAALGYVLVEAIKRDAIHNAEKHPAEYTGRTLQPFFIRVSEAIQEPRRRFFDRLIATSQPDEQFVLETMAQAIEQEQRILAGDLASPGDVNPRSIISIDVLRRLQDRGILVEADRKETARFMADSFWLYVSRFFGIGASREEDGRPKDVSITLLRPEPDEIMALFRGAGATIDQARKKLTAESERVFLSQVDRSINYWQDPAKHPEPGPFRNPETAGTYILTQFTTGEIKAYLQDLPDQSTISLAVDHSLKDIPWELMLEPGEKGEIRFRVGRSVVGKEPRWFSPNLQRTSPIRALLIGDPGDNLPDARREVLRLAESLRDHPHFEPEVRLGSAQCSSVDLLLEMQSGKYGLIHYSGHSSYEGTHSAWLLAGEDRIATDQLTNALQLSPPALVVSSSCESAQAGEQGPTRYEFQTYDLASAFLEAGIKAYVGTLWKIDSGPALEFSTAFYQAFLAGKHSLGECVRQGKWACKRHERAGGVPIDWLAFVLYGDPHALPGDLFPAIRPEAQD